MDRNQIIKRIERKRRKVRAHLRQINRVEHNCTEVNLPEGFNGNESDYWRLVNNNARFGLTEKQVWAAFRSSHGGNPDVLSLYDAAKLLAPYNPVAEILSRSVLFTEMNDETYRLRDRGFLNKMITRTLRKEEYRPVARYLAWRQHQELGSETRGG